MTNNELFENPDYNIDTIILLVQFSEDVLRNNSHLNEYII